MLPDPVCQLLAISDSQTTLAVPAQSWGAGTLPGGAGLVWGDSVRLGWLSWERCWKFAHLHPVLSMPRWLLSPKEGLPKDPWPGHKGELVSSGLQRQRRVGEPPQSSRDAESEPPPALAAQPSSAAASAAVFVPSALSISPMGPAPVSSSCCFAHASLP